MHRLICIAPLLLFALTACQPADATQASAQPFATKLRFTYWGSEMEKAAIEQMVVAFENANPERAEAIGADLRVSSSPGAGTCVEVTWNAN